MIGLLPLVMFLTPVQPPQAHQDMVLVQGAEFEPTIALGADSAKVRIESFWLDRDPVSNRDFLGFVTTHPEWQRGRISSLFAEPTYLEHWSSATSLGPSAGPKQPVVRVSWFAAKAYCEARGARLPSELEWEYASAASETQRDARKLPAWQSAILGWYAKPASQLGDVGAGKPNVWGVRDLHGLVWEWVLDFNTMLATGDSRGGPADQQTFCGAGAIGAGDRQDYAAFMRLAFFTSLQARYATPSLGFRCAKSAAEAPS